MAKGRAKRYGCEVAAVDYDKVLARDGMVCHICAKPIESYAVLDFDHVVALGKGGAHIESNVRPSHRLCNRRKR